MVDPLTGLHQLNRVLLPDMRNVMQRTTPEPVRETEDRKPLNVQTDVQEEADNSL